VRQKSEQRGVNTVEKSRSCEERAMTPSR